VIWLYAICEDPERPLPAGTGLEDAPVEGVRGDDLLAVVTRHDEAPAEPTPDAFWAHARVVERTMADRAVLPMRFASTLANDAAVTETLEARRQEFHAALDRVRGRVEVAVRAAQPRGEERTPTTGREYLEAKLRDTRGLHEPLSSLAVAARHRSGPGEVLRAAYLIEEENLPPFRSAVERLQRAHPEVSILCTGPWPPYSFVGEGLE
jgi:Gas vesicle synthesis protein GvpL/GvpF